MAQDSQPVTAYDFVARNPIARSIGSRKLKDICMDYALARRAGQDHGTAKKFALQSYSSIWIMLAWAALQVIFYLLKQWWENRKADANIRSPV